MAKSQQTFNKLEREKNKAKKREEKRKKMQARKEAREKGELKQDEFVYVDHLGNFTWNFKFSLNSRQDVHTGNWN